MSSSVRLVVPGTLAQRTGGYMYDARIVAELRAGGARVDVSELAGAFPLVDRAAVASAGACLAFDPAALLVVDGLALPAFARFRASLAERGFVALVHHPLARETGLSPRDAAALAEVEGALLAVARRVIVTSPTTARELEASGVLGDRITVVLPGTDPSPVSAPSPRGGRLLCAATITPRKGHALLVSALAELRDLPFHLVCAGSTARDRACVDALRAQIDAAGLGARIDLLGEVDDEGLARLYADADVFVLASHHEGYGMVLAEALARGLPIVSTTAGAIPDVVPADAGLLVAPGSAPALRGALRAVLSDPGVVARLRRGALAARERLPRWPEQGAAFARAIGIA